MDLAELQLKIKHDLEFFCEKFLKIREYDGPRLVPFQFNEAQRLIYSKVLQAQAEERPIRHIIIKARKEGVSTFYAALLYHLTATSPMTDAAICAHDSDTSVLLFDKIRIFYDASPALVQPMRKARSRKEIRFENPSPDPDEKRKNPGLLSTFFVDTAGSKEIARGSTLMGFHGSEVAFWGPNAAKQMLGVINAFPDHDPRTVVALESTANGPSGYFYDQVMKAYKTPEDSAYELIFLPWHIFEKYRIPLDEGEEFELQSDLEVALADQGISNEQLKWRRWAIKNKCDGDLNYFRQEYPATVEEAFIFTGRSVFDQEKLILYIQNAPNDPPRFEIDEANQMLMPNPGSDIKINPTEVDDAGMPLVRDGVSYLIGADVAEGLDISEDASRPDPDWTWVNIARRDNLKQILSWRTKIDPDRLGPMLEILGFLYNTAWICVEANNHGIVPCNHLKNNYPIYRLYLNVSTDHITDRYSEVVGFRTTSTSKAQAVSEAKRTVRDNDCWIFDKEMIHELQAFRQDARGRYSGDGSHDDGVTAFWLTVMMRLFSYESKPRDEHTDLVAIPTAKEMMEFDPAYRIDWDARKKRKTKQFLLGKHRK